MKRSFNETTVVAVWYDSKNNVQRAQIECAAPKMSVANARKVLRKRGIDVPSTAVIKCKAHGLVTYECTDTVFFKQAHQGSVIGGVNKTYCEYRYTVKGLTIDDDTLEPVEHIYGVVTTSEQLTDKQAKDFVRKRGIDVPSTARVFSEKIGEGVTYGMSVDEFKAIAHVVDTTQA